MTNSADTNNRQKYEQLSRLGDQSIRRLPPLAPLHPKAGQKSESEQLSRLGDSPGSNHHFAKNRGYRQNGLVLLAIGPSTNNHDWHPCIQRQAKIRIRTTEPFGR